MSAPRSPARPRLLQEHRAAFTLVETALVIGVVGVVLAVAIPTFLSALQTSKMAEASEQLQNLERAVTAYYALPRELEPQGAARFCLPAAAGPTPRAPSREPKLVDFHAESTEGAESWRALGFAPQEPLRYRYTYAPSAAGCQLPSTGAEIVLRAEGDLDGDGALSTFERRARTSSTGEVVWDPVLRVRDRVE